MWTFNHSPSGKIVSWISTTHSTRGSTHVLLKTIRNRRMWRAPRGSSDAWALLPRLSCSDNKPVNKIASVVKGANTSSVVNCLGVPRSGQNSPPARRVREFTQLTTTILRNPLRPALNGAIDSAPNQLRETRTQCLGDMPAGRCNGQQASSSRSVAVIGAGAGGLVAARELLREGHDVVVFEQGEEVGGVWVYDPNVESDLLGVDPDRSRVFSSIYKSLRTNLPREIMGFTDYPFVPRPGKGRDSRRFPSHTEVLEYLKDFAHDFNLYPLVKFGAKVEYVAPQSGEGINGIGWVLRFRRSKTFKVQENGDAPSTVDGNCDDPCQEEIETRVFDAVVLCNGHFAEARVVRIPGMESWPGEQIHSHNYRGPEPFRDKVVVVIGFASSGTDISQEVADLAREVHLCSRSWTVDDCSTECERSRKNTWRHPKIRKAHADRTVEFEDGFSVVVDVVIHCTGYLYSFPFLDVQDYISIEDNRVDPLYKHVFPPGLAPSLSIVGMNFKVIPFLCMEVQARWVAKVLAGKLSLPTQNEMLEDWRKLKEKKDAERIPRDQTHSLAPSQRTYIDWVIEQEGGAPVEAWRYDIYDSVAKYRKMTLDTYRESWHDQDLLDSAMASFEKHRLSELQWRK